MAPTQEVYFWPIERPPLGAAIWPRGVGHLPAAGAISLERASRFLCLHLVIGGRGSVAASQQEWTVAAGDLFCFWPGIRVRLAPDPEEPWERLWITVGGEGAMQYARAFGFDPRRLAIRARNFPRARRLFARMLELYRHQRDEDMAQVLGLLYRLVPICAPRPPSYRPRGGEAEGLLARAVAAIESFPHERFTVSQLARSLHMGRTTLYRAFRRQMGVSPAKYASNLRLDRAKGLLLSSDEKVSAIARAAGFADEKYFLRLFRKRVGLTPSQFRKQDVAPAGRFPP